MEFLGVDPLYLVYGGIFLCVMLGAEGLYLLVRDWQQGSQRVANRRQRLLASGHSSQAILERLRRRKAEGTSVLARLDRLITQAGLTISTTKLVLWMAGAAVGVLALGSSALTLPAALVLPGSMALGVALPVLYLMLRRRRRAKKFSQQLPDAVDIVVRSLRAGHPVPTAMKLVSEQMSDPLGTEIGLVVDEMTFGSDLREALEKLAERIDHEDLRYMVVAIKIQHGSGGNLAEVLEGLSRVIRARARMFAKVRALAAEGRLSAVIVGSLPVVVPTITTMLNPDYYGGVADDPLFPIGMGLSGVLIVIGNLVIYRMVNFRV